MPVPVAPEAKPGTANGSDQREAASVISSDLAFGSQPEARRAWQKLKLKDDGYISRL